MEIIIALIASCKNKNLTLYCEQDNNLDHGVDFLQTNLWEFKIYFILKNLNSNYNECGSVEIAIA